MRTSVATVLVLSLCAAVSVVRSAPGGKKSIIVELKSAEPLAVAAHTAQVSRQAFNEAAHKQVVESSQEQFLTQLRALHIEFRITETVHKTAAGEIRKPNRFNRLINAVALEVPDAAVELIRGMPNVRHITMDEPVKLNLDHSVQYIRGNDGPGNKTIFKHGGSELTRFDGTGQVIAVLDTGIEHSHPMFDTRFSDAEYTSRTGDARPVRLAGQEYVEGTNHPKVVYFLPLTGTTNEDDVGHGTHGAADAAGLKAAAPGLDRIPGNTDDQIVEGVAPGALLMNYKICETIFTCVGSANIVMALEDALSPTDVAGFPKPVATVVNMSFGGGGGSPDDASSVAASNAALLGAVMVASAGNSGAEGENSVGAPCAGARVTCVGATIDPGAATNELDVTVPDPARYTSANTSTGAQNDTGRPSAPEDLAMKLVIMGGAPDVTYPLGQHYVYVGLADTPDQVPDAVSGRIALAARGSTVENDTTGTGLFGHKAAECIAKGAIAIVIFNNVDGELEAASTQASTIPAYGLSKANGEYLLDVLGFASPSFDKDDRTTWGTISNFPIRLNPPDPLTFSAATTGFSSRGPAENYQYLKPDVTAPGESIYSATIPAGGVGVQPLPPAVGGTMSDPSRYIGASGTSFSGPHVAGTAALVRHSLLALRGASPIEPALLRSGEGAALQQQQNAIAPQAIVRAMLSNTATNLRESDNVTILPQADDRNFIHEIGSGLVHVVEAVDTRAIMGTNIQNGPDGPDDASSDHFLGTHSFGSNVVLNNFLQNQVSTVTVTLENLSGAGGGGGYALSLVDGGANRGDVTLPITGTTGFTLGLSVSSVALGNEIQDRATFNVSVSVDGRPTPTGLATAGTDIAAIPASEFLWWVVATGVNGEVVRMPFYYRAVESLIPAGRPAPFQLAVQDDTPPDQGDGVDPDGNYTIAWTYPNPPSAEPPCGFEVQTSTSFGTIFTDDAEEPLVAGSNSTWQGDAGWSTQNHPDTGTSSYSPSYTDNANTALRLASPISIPAGTAAFLSFDSFEETETDFDFCIVEASGDGGPYLVLSGTSGSFSGRREVDLSGLAGQDVVVQFRFTSDNVTVPPTLLGWFIDNIELQVSNWSTVATMDGSARSHDVTGQSEGTYAYRVAAMYEDPCAVVGPFSNIRSITVFCDESQIEPTFGGVQSVNAAAQETCGLNLTWNEGLSGCITGLVKYNVYRGTAADFTPAVENLVAVGLSTLNFADQPGLVSGTTYYYVVRAEDGATGWGGPANNGNEDDNFHRLSGTPHGPFSPAGGFSDDVEPGAEAGYVADSNRDAAGWSVTTDPTASSATNAWVALDEQPGSPSGTPGDDRLTLPVMDLSSTSVLTFKHNYDFAGYMPPIWVPEYHSGGVIEISADGNAWFDLGPFITSGGYNGMINSAATNVIPGRSAWVGSSDAVNGARTDAMSQVVVDLGAAIQSASTFNASQLIDARIRFRLAGTFQLLIGGTQGSGWGVDDIQITNLLVAGSCISQACGDGIVNAEEECDDGAFNSNSAPDACRTNCTAPRCGDEVTDTDESCDDGNVSGGDGCSATCALEPGTPTAEPGGSDKNRYLSFQIAQTTPPVAEMAIQIQLVELMRPVPDNLPQFPAPDFSAFEGEVRYVGTPTDCQENESPPASFKCAGLQCAPHYMDFAAAIAGQTLHVSGIEIVPSSAYTVRTLAASCAGNEANCDAVSGALSIRTQRWGDVIAPYQDPSGDINQPNISDIASLVDKFKGVDGAPIVARGDLHPGEVNFTSNIADVASCIDAFKNFAYPFNGPADCP